MAETLLICLPVGPKQQATWVVLEDGRLAAQPERGELSNASSFASGRLVVLVVPGEDVLLTEVDLPTQSRQKILRAVPYALEDQVADEVEQLHFALGPGQDSGAYPVVVVKRDRMEQWLGQAGDAGLSVDMIIPDSLLVPWNETGLAVLLEGDRVLCRNGQYAAFSVDRENAETIIGITTAAMENESASLNQYTCNETQALPAPPGLELVDHPCEGGSVSIFAKHFQASKTINLLQGDFSRTERLSQLWRPWKATVLLLLLGLLVFGVQKGLEYRTLSQENESLRGRIEQIYRTTFPQAKRVVNPRAQMQQHLVELRGGSAGSDGSFLELLALCGPVLKANKAIQLRGASYRDGRLELDITAKDLQVLDQLKQQLVATGELEAEIQSATSDDKQQVKSRLRIRKVGS